MNVWKTVRVVFWFVGVPCAAVCLPARLGALFADRHCASCVNGFGTACAAHYNPVSIGIQALRRVSMVELRGLGRLEAFGCFA